MGAHTRISVSRERRQLSRALGTLIGSNECDDRINFGTSSPKVERLKKEKKEAKKGREKEKKENYATYSVRAFRNFVTVSSILGRVNLEEEREIDREREREMFQRLVGLSQLIISRRMALRFGKLLINTEISRREISCHLSFIFSFSLPFFLPPSLLPFLFLA